MSPLAWFLIATALGNILGYVLIVRDKRAAKQGGRRRPEDTFSILALFGLWPGMVLAMRNVRHKTRKRKFQGQLAFASFMGTLIWMFLLFLMMGL